MALIDAAKRVAEGEHRTLSNYILTLIAQDIETRESGNIKEQPGQYLAKPASAKPKRAAS